MAIQIIREVIADVVKRGATKVIYAKQHDFNSRFLKIRIQVDGVDFDVKPTSRATLNVSRPDKSTKKIGGSVNSDGTVTIPMDSWMLDLAGTIQCDVSVVEEEGTTVSKLTTMKFSIRVEEEVVCDDSCVTT